MCNDCVMHLSMATDFKTQCQKSETQLREALSIYSVPEITSNNSSEFTTEVGKVDIDESKLETAYEDNSSKVSSNFCEQCSILFIVFHVSDLFYLISRADLGTEENDKKSLTFQIQMMKTIFSIQQLTI